AKLSAHGHLDLVTGNGEASVTAPTRVTVNINALGSQILSALPDAWAKPLAHGATIYAGGSKGALTAVLRADNDAASVQTDVDVGLSAGETWAHAVARGKASGDSQGIPNDVNLEEIRLEANRIPLSVGELTGSIRIGDVSGPFVTAQGNS